MTAYLNLTQEEEDVIWDNAFFVFDTNVLLDLYRFSKKTRTDLFEILKDLRGELWMPYIISEEFMENRLNAVTTYMNELKKSNKDTEEKNNQFKNRFKIRVGDDDANQILKEIENISSSLKVISDKLDELDEELKVPVNTYDDTILNEIFNIFEKKVGIPLTEEEKEKYEQIGAERYEKKIPPGYMDKAKEKNKYGDFIIWKSAINYAKENKKNLIFITNDLKKDWVSEKSRDNVRPNIELVNEFIEKTEQKFLLYSLDIFCDKYRTKKNKCVNIDTVKEVKKHIEYYESKQNVANLLKTIYENNVRPINAQGLDLLRLDETELSKLMARIGFEQKNDTIFDKKTYESLQKNLDSSILIQGTMNNINNPINKLIADALQDNALNILNNFRKSDLNEF